MNERLENLKAYPRVTEILIKHIKRSKKGLKNFKQLSESRDLTKFEHDCTNRHKVCLYYAKATLEDLAWSGFEHAKAYIQWQYNYKKMYDRKPDPFKRYLLDAELDYEDCVKILEKYLRLFDNTRLD